nr:UPF0323 family lipoprotein [Campylobacter sp.]
MKHTKTFKDIAKAGVLGSILAFGLSGCDMGGNTNAQNIQKQGATVFIEKNNDGSYSVADEFPSNETRVFLRETGIDGKISERLLSQDEIDSLLAQANTMIDQNASGLTNASLSSGGLSLGEAILASAAGAIIGSWIGSKLFGSPTYQNTRQAAYKNPSAYSRSVNNFQNARSATSSSSKKSGFFGGGSKSSSGSSMGG